MRDNQRNRPNSPEKKVIAKLKIRTTSIFVRDSRALVIYLFISVFCVSGLAIVRVGIVWGAIVRVGNSPGVAIVVVGNCRGWQLSGWELSGGQLSGLGIVRVGIVWGIIVRGDNRPGI